MGAVAAGAVGDLDRRRRARRGRGSCRRRSASGRAGGSTSPSASPRRGRACTTCGETLAAATGERGSFGERMLCSPWQSVQAGASVLPFVQRRAVDARRRRARLSARGSVRRPAGRCILLTGDARSNPCRGVVVRPVAIDAGRRPRVAAQQGRAVDAVLVGGDEARARGHLLAHRLVLQVARQAEALLGSFPREQVGNPVGGDRLAMAREAGRLLRGARALARTVLGTEQRPGDLAVAPPARRDFPRRRERKGRVLDRRRVVPPVAAKAIRLGRLSVGAGRAHCGKGVRPAPRRGSLRNPRAGS